MITKSDILPTASSALTQAIHAWLDEHRQPLPKAITHSLANAARARPWQETSPKKTARPLLTTAEVAERWRRCIHTVQRRIRTGELPRLVMNQGHILIPLDAVLKFENNATVPRP